jgi:hypothetical protein
MVKHADVVGSLARHALQRHNGTAIFLSTDGHEMIFYEAMKIFVSHSPYKDKYFNSFEGKLSHLDIIHSFELDRRDFAEAQRMLIEDRVVTEIVRRGQLEEKVFVIHYY